MKRVVIEFEAYVMELLVQGYSLCSFAQYTHCSEEVSKQLCVAVAVISCDVMD